MSRESLPEAVQAATSAAWTPWQSDASVGEGRDSQDHLLCELPLHLVGDACIPAFLERALYPVAQVLVVRRCRTERRRVAGRMTSTAASESPIEGLDGLVFDR